MLDEVQYISELFPYIKMECDRSDEKGRFLLTGSQQYHLMKNISESLAGRIAILELAGFSMRELTERNAKMSAKELLKRAVFMLLRICVTSFGLEVAVKADLGLSPLTTLAYAMNHIFPGVSLGIFTFLQQCCYVLLTVLLLRREFKIYQLLILPCSFLYGYVIDLSAMLMTSFSVSNYFARLVLMLLSCVIVAWGFSMILNSGVCLDANTTFVSALSKKMNLSYSKVKVATDIITVALAAVVALAALRMVVGIREGTVISAVIIGPMVGFFGRYISKLNW